MKITLLGEPDRSMTCETCQKTVQVTMYKIEIGHMATEMCRKCLFKLKRGITVIVEDNLVSIEI